MPSEKEDVLLSPLDSKEMHSKILDSMESRNASNDSTPIDRSRLSSSWRPQRKYPKAASSALSFSSHLAGSSSNTGLGPPQSKRVDFSGFINSMDDLSFAYFSLVREHASRYLQGNALQYESFYKAMACQQFTDERHSRVSVIEFDDEGSSSKTFDGYDDFWEYMNESNSFKGRHRRLFLLEDLPVRMVCLLGSRLRIHPGLFANHYSTEDSANASDDIVAFPSFRQVNTSDGLDYASSIGFPLDGEKRRFVLRFPIIMPRVSAAQSANPELCPHWLKPCSRLTDQSAYPRFILERRLDTPTVNDRWDAKGEVSELEGQVTYWSHENPGGGWDGESHFHCAVRSKTLSSRNGEIPVESSHRTSTQACGRVCYLRYLDWFRKHE